MFLCVYAYAPVSCKIYRKFKITSYPPAAKNMSVCIREGMYANVYVRMRSKNISHSYLK